MTDPDLWRDVLGIRLPPVRVGENLAAFAVILGEIAKLRDLDLGAVHPAVVFRPLSGGRFDDNA